MSLFEIFRTAIESLAANKLRTVLTMLGVIIGVTSVVTLLALGAGVSNNITNSIQGNGTNVLSISPDGRVGNARLTLDDVDALADPLNVPQLDKVVPTVSGNLKITYGTNTRSTSVQGTTPDYFVVRTTKLDKGTFFTQADLDSRTRVAILGASLATALFPDSDPIGQTILMGNVPFRVIATTVASGGFGPGNADDNAFVPLTVAQEKLFAKRNDGLKAVSSISAQLHNSKDADAATTAITAVLRQRHNLVSGQADDFRIFNQAQLLSTLNTVVSTLTAFLAAIGAISLIVGGIGIMNIMLVSVTERTREIGVRKAIGARRWAIRLQFLIEALTVTMLAGAIGTLLGVGLSALIGSVQTSIVPQVQLNSIIIAFGVSVFIGVVFGLYPAWRASLLSPVEALRYE